ncbi:MAG TPA: transglutaminase family protein [Puia sp.]|jgi:transglutaminase-like putative cysteine protease|nr:transglutaminase family protein [Puia sp.]
MKYLISHQTTYTYHEPVSVCYNLLRLVPRNTHRQSCTSVAVEIHPEPDTFHEYEDFFGNKVIYFSIEKEHAKLSVRVSSEIEQRMEAAGDRSLEQDADIGGYLFETPMTAANDDIAAYARGSFLPGRPVLEAAGDLMHRIYTDFRFTPGFTTVSTPLAMVMRERKGVCQDFAHLAIACCRSAGLPARYVSGYIETLPPPGVEKLIGVDASHAWFSVYIPNLGWVDFDPTNNLLPAEQHVTIGWGRDYADIAPMRGILLSSGTHGLSVSVDMRRVE